MNAGPVHPAGRPKKSKMPSQQSPVAFVKLSEELTFPKAMDLFLNYMWNPAAYKITTAFFIKSKRNKDV